MQLQRLKELLDALPKQSWFKGDPRLDANGQTFYITIGTHPTKEHYNKDMVCKVVGTDLNEVRARSILIMNLKNITKDLIYYIEENKSLRKQLDKVTAEKFYDSK